MNPKKILPIAGAFLGILLLILDGRTALLGAQVGITLCLKTIVPALFPFFVLSILLTNALADVNLPLLSFLCGLLRIPQGCESVLITGFLGGYPTGAQSVSQLYKNNNLSKQGAERLLAFCNNAGPSFLFGIVGQQFEQRQMVWLLWMIHICGAVFAAALIPLPYHRTSHMPNQPSCSIQKAVQEAIRVNGSVCAWIVLFRILITFLERWILWLFPIPVRVALSGLLELSNGCIALSQIGDVKLRFLICSALLGAGGLCVTMQTSSVVEGLTMKYYLFGKLIQVGFSLVSGLALIYGVWVPLAILMGGLAVSIAKKQNFSSIRSFNGV